jgi:hypothetical protein
VAHKCRSFEDLLVIEALSRVDAVKLGGRLVAVPQPGVQVASALSGAPGGISMRLRRGFMHDETNKVSLRIGNDMALAGLDLLAGASKPRGPSLSVVFTDWLSMTPAAGLASRPAFSRTAMTKA